MPDHDSREDEKKHPTEDDPKAKSITAPSPPYAPSAEPTQGVSDHNMQAQVKGIEERVKRAERWMIGLTAAIAFFGLCAVIVGGLQWNAMTDQLAEMKSGGVDTHTLAEASKKQADHLESLIGTAKEQNATMSKQLTAMQKQVEVVDRPWIKVEFMPEIPLTFRDGNKQVEMGFHATMTNVGRTVATNVRFQSEMFLLSKKIRLPEAVKRIKEVCQECTSVAIVEWAIFPQDKAHISPRSIINIEQNTRLGDITQDCEHWINPIIVGCVDYQFASSPVHHQTGFMYNIFAINPAKTGFANICIGINIPADRLRMDNWIPGAYIAN